MPSEAMVSTGTGDNDIAACLKTALRRMPGAVALITTSDDVTGTPAGLAATAMIAVSMDPPSMLISVNRSASAHAVIERSGRFCINLLGRGQTGLLAAFSQSGLRAQRFVDGAWSRWSGLPYLTGAPASIFCIVRNTVVFGTHEMFVGEVAHVTCAAATEPLGWFEGDFAILTRMGAAS